MPGRLKTRQSELTKRFVDDDVGKQEDHEHPVSTSFQQAHDLGRVFPFLFISRGRQHYVNTGGKSALGPWRWIPVIEK